jgi:hypothetical protein
MSTSNRTIKWIENLAEQELLIRAGERASIDICSTKDEVLSVETSAFLRDLYHHIDYLVRLFNSRMVESDLQIKLQRTTDNANGFQISRNHRRLMLSGPNPGVVHFQCEKFLSGTGEAVRTQKTSVLFSGMVEARFGTFHDVEWFSLGSKITSEQLSRHYLTEFIQVSRGDSAES